MKKVIVFGTFDLLHPGHVYVLNEARKHGDYLVAVVARDETVEKIKGKVPRNNQEIRLKNLEKLHLADTVRLGNTGDKFKILDEEKPDVIILGYDQEIDLNKLEERKPKHAVIIRLDSFHPEKYKSSLLTEALC